MLNLFQSFLFICGWKNPENFQIYFKSKNILLPKGTSWFDIFIIWLHWKAYVNVPLFLYSSSNLAAYLPFLLSKNYPEKDLPYHCLSVYHHPDDDRRDCLTLFTCPKLALFVDYETKQVCLKEVYTDMELKFKVIKSKRCLVVNENRFFSSVSVIILAFVAIFERSFFVAALTMLLITKENKDKFDRFYACVLLASFGFGFVQNQILFLAAVVCFGLQEYVYQLLFALSFCRLQIPLV